MTSDERQIVDITRRQLGRLAAVGAGALVSPGLLPPSTAAAATPPAGTWGDQGDGTYANPILPADLSDWDCIRVGSDYYGITSTFGYSPGMAVLHSKDLVNWRTLGGSVDDVTRIGPELNWDRMNRYGRGVWAGALRHQLGRYWLYFNTPDEGSGWSDVCPFWEDDGQGYLVTTHYSDNYKIHLYKLSEDGKSLVGPAPVGQQAVQDRRCLLPPVQRGEIRGPGAHDEPRLQHLRPVRDQAVAARQHLGGPRAQPGRAGAGSQRRLVLGDASRHRRLGGARAVPAARDLGGRHRHHGVDRPGARRRHARSAGRRPAPVVTSDLFTDTRLGPQWEWHYQPRADHWSLTERPGYLRLKAFAPLAADNLTKAGNTLTQRVLRTAGGATVTARLELAGLADGQHAGLCHYAATYIGLGVRRPGTTTTIAHNAGGTLTNGPEITQNAVWLRTSWDVNGVSRFSYSLNGTTFTAYTCVSARSARSPTSAVRRTRTAPP
ncbi:family 43 glycosylhydrolase [Streptomyces sp. UG1]|uniref:family 43 glycosylhydrolase n=1 Tax=Streptomyces sp. UG1 TaxID=3417652 RepID=UPI003CED8AFD